MLGRVVPHVLMLFFGGLCCCNLAELGNLPGGLCLQEYVQDRMCAPLGEKNNKQNFDWELLGLMLGAVATSTRTNKGFSSR